MPLIQNFLVVLTSVVTEKIQILVGLHCCYAFGAFIVLSLPLFAYRVVILHLAKLLRHDLAEIFSGGNTIFLDDYFSAKPPRSNCLLALKFRGKLKYEDVKARILTNWINLSDETAGKFFYKRLHQCPCRWLGFTFWKDVDAPLDIDNHVHRLHERNMFLNDEKLDEIIETCLNRRIPKYISPWEVYVIERYSEQNRGETSDDFAVLLVKWHHVLADGKGMITMVERGLLEQCAIAKLITTKKLSSKRPTWQRLCYYLWFPFAVLREATFAFYNRIRKSSFKVNDSQKEWHQTFTSSRPISIQLIKSIKNKFEATFESVIFSAISSALNKLEANEETLFCMSIQSKENVTERNVLDNHITPVMFYLPVKRFQTAEERLKSVHINLRRKKSSVLPTLMDFFVEFVGAHLNFFSKILIKNKAAVVFSNLPGFTNLLWDEECKLVLAHACSGGPPGDHGAFIVVMGAGDDITINVSAEKALMTKQHAQQFVSHIVDELQVLGDIVHS